MATGGSSPQKTPAVKQFPMIDEWSIKEKLALASQVQRCKDQNWFGVSRALRSLFGAERPDESRDKVIIEDERGQIVEKAVTSWFEKKNCARQFHDLLEKVQENKPKTSGRSNRRGSGRDGSGTETDESTIVKELTQKRREELQEQLKIEHERLKKIQEEIDIANGPDPPEELLKMIWERKVAEEKEKKLKEEKNREWLKEREAKFIDATRRYRPGTKSTAGSPRTPGTTVITVTSKPDGQSQTKDNKPPGLSVVLIDTSSGQGDSQVAASPGQNPPPSSSPLLTSLLQNPPEKSPDNKSTPPGLTLGQTMGTPGKASPSKASPTKGQQGSRSAFFDPSSALASAAARQFTQPGSTSPGPSQPGSGTNTPRSISPAKSVGGVDVHSASPTLSKLLEIPISNVSGGNKLPPLPVIERIPRTSTDSHEGLMKDIETKQVKEELLTEDESANDGLTESTQEGQGLQPESVDETSSSIPGDGEDSSVAGNVGRSPRASRSDVSEDKNKSTPQTRRSARQQIRGSVSKVLAPATPPVQAPPPLTAKPVNTDTPATPSSTPTPSAPTTRRSTRVRTKLESEGENSNHPPSESSKVTARASVSEADQSTMDATAAPDSELLSEESSESMPTAAAPKLEAAPGIAGSVTGHMSTSTKRGPSSLFDVDSVPNSPASSNYGGINEETKDWRKWQRDMLEKLKTVRTHQLAGEFWKPVTLKGYDETVKRPMDLTTIRHKLTNGEIRTMAEFKRDVMLIFINATMYNAPDIEVHQDALEVLKEFLIDIEEYEKTCPAIIVPPPQSGRNSAAGQLNDQQTMGMIAAGGDVKSEKIIEGRITPTPRVRNLPTRRRGDSSSVVSEIKDSDSIRTSRRVRGVSTDTDPGASTAVSTTPSVTSTATGQATPLSSGTLSAPKTRSKKVA